MGWVFHLRGPEEETRASWTIMWRVALCKTWPAGPGGTLCLPRSGTCTLLRTWCRRPRVWLPRLRHSCSGDIDSSVRFLLSRPRHACWPGGVCCVGVWISSGRLCLCPGPCTLLSCRLGCLCSPSLPCCAGGDSLPQPQRSLDCVSCRRPALPSIQASRVKASHSLHPQSRRKQACRL